jgi:PKD repeat protein
MRLQTLLLGSLCLLFVPVSAALAGEPLVPPAADFSASPTSGTAPLTVDFTDLSSGEVTSWWWEFGDATSSAEQDPSHQYTEVGSYTVSLTAANAAGSDTETKTKYIALMFPDADLEHWACEEILACVDAGIVSGYEDGLYHPEIVVTRDQMAVYIARALVAPSGEAALADYVPANPRNFPDVPPDFWAYTHIEYCVENGVVTGYEDGLYYPEYEITRDQMAVYVARALVAPTGEAALADYVPADPRNFPDVPEDFWACAHVEYCVEHGVVRGYEDGLYHPEIVVTRDQMAVYVARIILPVGAHLELHLERSAAGLRVASLVDVRTGRELAAAEAVPLFEITLRDGESGADVLLTADADWQEVTMTESAGELLLGWSSPEDTRLQGVSVMARATLDPGRSAWHWDLEVDCAGTPWAVRHVVFPQLAVAELGRDSTVFYASGPGIEKQGVWQEPFTFRGFYPGWDVSMQFLAAYNHEEVPSGLYFAMHDPDGCAKDVVVESQGNGQGVRLAFEQVAPNLGAPGNGFVLRGEAVWQLFRGDWFDAARIYRDWVRAEATWWPTLTAQGREDTALAMRELPVWTLGCCDPEGVASPAERFQEYLGVPVGMHWYYWHEIPFDNDYPHYFPAKPGVAEATRELQAANVMVMPYINARLWDTRDRDTEDWQFTATALPWATKDEQGNPVVESYGSTESDGSPVQMAVMCPATALWQQTVNEICEQLFQEVGVDAVYLDQVAAARPVPCMAENHGHLPGGGSWWNEGYWQMLAAIRAAMPEGAFLTSEANAEVFAKWLDGFLVWHWQSDGMVPAFPAVYGGAVQMFGRSYWGEDGAVGEEALCAKAGQQLVFGEQLGWIYPWVVDRPSADFFRNLVQTRWLFRLYFYAGEMARPPRLEGEMPVVRSDWYWYGENWVTTDAVLTGAWRIPAAGQMVLFFVNVSDQPVTLTHRLSQDSYDISAAGVSRVTVVNGVPSAAEPLALPLVEVLHFAPRQVLAWELQW